MKHTKVVAGFLLSFGLVCGIAASAESVNATAQLSDEELRDNLFNSDVYNNVSQDDYNLTLQEAGRKFLECHEIANNAFVKHVRESAEQGKPVVAWLQWDKNPMNFASSEGECLKFAVWFKHYGDTLVSKYEQQAESAEVSKDEAPVLID